MARGLTLSGKLRLCRATHDERAAIDKLLGRLPTQGSSLTVDLDNLAETLSHANACKRLEDAVVELCGPICNERLLSLSRDEEWEKLWQTCRGQVGHNPAAIQWIDGLKVSGLLKRIAEHDLRRAEMLLRQSVSVIER